MKSRLVITIVIPIAAMSVIGMIVFGLAASSHSVDKHIADKKNHEIKSGLFIPVDYDKKDLELFASTFCSNNNLLENDTGVFMTCLHPEHKAGIVFELPPPRYKLELCRGTYGCIANYVWIPQIPSNLVSEEQKQKIVDMVLQLPETKNWHSKPILDHFLISSSKDNWRANVQFFIEGVKMPQHNQCEYYDSATIDLEILYILDGFRDFDDFEKCEN